MISKPTLTDWRKARKLTVKQFAQKLNIDDREASYILKGYRGEIFWDHEVQIYHILGITKDQYIDAVEAMSDQRESKRKASHELSAIQAEH